VLILLIVFEARRAELGRVVVIASGFAIVHLLLTLKCIISFVTDWGVIDLGSLYCPEFCLRAKEVQTTQEPIVKGSLFPLQVGSLLPCVRRERCAESRC